MYIYIHYILVWMNVCSPWSACNYSRIEIRFVFYAIWPTSCNWLQRVIAAGNLQLAALIGQFVRSLIFHAIIFWCYIFCWCWCCCCFTFCTIAEWWKPQRGFARFYWLCSVPQGSFVRHSGVWQSEVEEQEEQLEWLAQQSVVVWAMPTDILWTTSMHRSYRCVFYTLSKCLFSSLPLSRLLTRLFSPLCGLATDVAYFCDSFSCSHFHWPFPFFIANSVCGWLWCCNHKMNFSHFSINCGQTEYPKKWRLDT